MDKKIILLLLLTGCTQQPELDPVKVQIAINEIGKHVIALEKAVYTPMPTPEAKMKVNPR